jgi:hypothetical protein
MLTVIQEKSRNPIPNGPYATVVPTTEGRFLVTITVTDTEASAQSASLSLIDPIVRIT